MLTTDQERQFIERVQDGDVAAFGLLYDAYVEPIYRFVFYKTHNQEAAEDLTSQVFTKAIENIGRYQLSKGSFRTWLYQITRNTIVDHYRKTHSTTSIEDAWEIPSTTDLTQEFTQTAEFEEIRKHLSRLTTLQRDIIVMRLWEDLSYTEIAAALGKSEGSCKMAYKRGVLELKQNMSLSLFLLLFLVGKL